MQKRMEEVDALQCQLEKAMGETVRLRSVINQEMTEKKDMKSNINIMRSQLEQFQKNEQEATTKLKEDILKKDEKIEILLSEIDKKNRGDRKDPRSGLDEMNSLNDTNRKLAQGMGELKHKLAMKEGALLAAQKLAKNRAAELSSLNQKLEEEQKTRQRCYKEALSNAEKLRNSKKRTQSLQKALDEKDNRDREERMCAHQSIVRQLQNSRVKPAKNDLIWEEFQNSTSLFVRLTAIKFVCSVDRF
eukprot:GHVL01022408.1.p1 GENE.GHVL01022408.1~~GHVL01022408.1.p1  ORF type:complete len:278 (+),score=83.65 GHVL01022408.1:98-835(+)